MTAIRAQQLFLVEIPTPLSENQQIILAYGQQNDRPFNRIQDYFTKVTMKLNKLLMMDNRINLK
jgi:hypothetical protein